MSEMAKKARAAMKSKAERLGASRPLERVDAATWTPPELLNADVKTGMRPISKRQFKKGGKVKGEPTVARADRKPRKSGGRAITANSLVNRDVKEANQERDGIKHIGGMKKGGRAKKANGGGESMPLPPKRPPQEVIDRLAKGQSPRATNVEPSDNFDPEQVKRLERGYKKGGKAKAKCYGGKAKKNVGGAMAGAKDMMDKARETAGVPSDVISSVPAQSRFSKTAGLKKGGKAEGHSDEAMDRALIKKMVKSSARTGKSIGGILGEGLSPALTLANALRGDKKSGGRTGKADGGPKYSPEQEAATLRDQGMALRKYGKPRDDKDDSKAAKIASMMASKMRSARKAGGRTKGKTNINIVIAAGKPQGQGAMPPADAPVPPAGLPVPVPPPQGAPQGMPMPMPMPPQGGAPAGAPPMPPMARKAGGRISKVAKSYKDMTAGAGSGEGRLQKTDIAKRNAHKAGGKVYRSYKDMDAGAGSGMGRLEKTEIQSRKK